ncbi:MAG TPA: hypothetical protein VNE16_01825 [Vicinamibacterales bacterium]|nr:hypothetical protein [Vicinamibacterales bacterium]
MTRRFALALLAAIALAGCFPRARVNADCRWTGDAATPLGLTRAADRRELTDDVALAEDFAIRYADRTRGLRSGHYAGADAYHAARERCMAMLLADIGRLHGVAPQRLAALRGRRPLMVDVAVGLSFAVIYLLVATLLAGGLVHRFPPDDPLPAVVASCLVAIGLSAAVMFTLPVWAGAIEVIRVGNVHLSYRALRLPWSRHRAAVFLTALLLFLAVAGARYQRAQQLSTRAATDS